MIYINGDSHSAGAELVKDYCFAEDDPRYGAWGRRPHPESTPLTFGYKLAQTLNQPFHTDAESASSNARILRTATKFVEETNNKRDLFVLIGWTTWEREEWKYGEDYLQVTASGTDSVPENMVEEYKKWVIKQTPQELERKKLYWQNLIMEFSSNLDDLGIKHLFFTTDEYTQYLKEHGYQTVNNGYHFGVDGHVAWYKKLLPEIQSQYIIKTGLTNTPKRSIVTKAKQQFKGFN
jgi:hypothetical protein